ncbi:hypothetical protein F5Y17DRAFT_347719 [Xylariaceae sp. FL0594]|nr:hypothetical protein F5Y17DRAFT_347719 [Xylariaceae sp. FL0594]
MDDPATRAYYEAKSTRLRAELKQFEADWASRNGGKKPSRQDIKQNPSIASKYKKYNEVRDIVAGKIQIKAPAAAPSSRKRNSEEAAVAVTLTPSKRSRSIQTPSKVRIIDVEAEDRDDTFQTPSSRTLFSPAMPTSIGPTPQKNGRVLGLFDLLEEDTENAPPDDDTAGGKTQATPSKQPVSRLDLGRTPKTPSRRDTNLHNSFTTPKGRKDGTNYNNPLGARTPSSASKLLSTPAFLRRAPPPLLSTVDEDGRYIYDKSPEPVKLRLPRKPLGRSLSSVVASLRKMEEEKLDDELEALREMENEDAKTTTSKNTNNNTAKSATTTQPTVAPAQAPVERPEILEPDSQTRHLLGGFDDEGLYDSPTEADKATGGLPMRVYKKKGQKRTTRRVNMRPTRAKRATAPLGEASGSDDDNDNEVVPETQFDPNRPIEEMPEVDDEDDDEDDESGSEFGGGDDDDEEDVPAEDAEEDAKTTAKKKKNKKNTKLTKPAPSKDKKEKKEGAIKKVARKVNELAHANFKRLKLRNSGSKGGPGFGSRFRRRR